MIVVSADLETLLLAPGVQAPPPVCGQWIVGYDHSTQLVHANPRIGGQLHQWMEFFLSGGHLLNGHNFAFDMAVLCAYDTKALLPLVFQAYDEDRVTCTQIRQTMFEIAAGTHHDGVKYNLASCLERVCGYTLDKLDPWRLKYGTLYEVPIHEWPEDAKRYALLDAQGQRDLYFGQEELAARIPGVFEDQFRQARAAFWLHLASCWGVMTDRAAIDRYKAAVEVDLDRDKALCQAHGLVRGNGKRDTKAAAERMQSVCESKGLPLRKTKTGGTTLDEDACLATGDAVLLAYQRYGSATSLMSKVDRLYKGTEIPLQPRYSPLKETSRTSVSQGDDPKAGEAATSYGTQMQNPPQDADKAREGKPTFRECLVARGVVPLSPVVQERVAKRGKYPRRVLCSVDYDGAELVTWSQQVIDLGFDSEMARVLNEGRDPHTELGCVLAQIDRAEGYARKNGERGQELKDEWKAKWRQCAKPANFGLPGGMGPATFKSSARMLYGVDLDELKMDPQFVVNAWATAWPEAAHYLNWVRENLGPDYIIHKETGKRIPVGTFRDSRSGFIRAKCPYNVYANMPFQHRAASMAKAAGWALTQEMYLATKASPLYGSRMWAFVHDEFLVEMDEDRASDAGYRMAEVAVSAAKPWVPDVKLTAAPTLMYHWHKGAEKVTRKDGTLIPWDGEEAKEMRKKKAA